VKRAVLSGRGLAYMMDGIGYFLYDAGLTREIQGFKMYPKADFGLQVHLTLRLKSLEIFVA